MTSEGREVRREGSGGQRAERTVDLDLLALGKVELLQHGLGLLAVTEQVKRTREDRHAESGSERGKAREWAEMSTHGQ